MVHHWLVSSNNAYKRLRTLFKLDELAAQVRDLSNRIEKTVPPKLRVASRLEDVREKYQSTKNEFEDVRKQAKKAKIDFEELKRKRRTFFMDCFNFVSEKIDDTYKEISRNPGAQAYLSVDNHEEPYLDGVRLKIRINIQYSLFIFSHMLHIDDMHYVT